MGLRYRLLVPSEHRGQDFLHVRPPTLSVAEQKADICKVDLLHTIGMQRLQPLPSVQWRMRVQRRVMTLLRRPRFDPWKHWMTEKLSYMYMQVSLCCARRGRQFILHSMHHRSKFSLYRYQVLEKRVRIAPSHVHCTV